MKIIIASLGILAVSLLNVAHAATPLGLPPVPVPEEYAWQLYATGLNVPTGMAVVDDRVFVSHRPEVTELLDPDGDGVVEEVRTVMGPWSLKDGFHEYAFGLAVDPAKRFYVGLNNGYFWSYGGPTSRGRHRSAIVRCDLAGHSEEWGRGCRVPTGPMTTRSSSAMAGLIEWPCARNRSSPPRETTSWTRSSSCSRDRVRTVTASAPVPLQLQPIRPA